jgi:cell division protein FtsZ
VGATFDDELDGTIRVSVVATGIGLLGTEAARLVSQAPRVPAMQERSRLSERLAGLAALPGGPVDLDEPSLVLAPSEVVREPSVWRAPGNVTIEKRPAQATGMALPLGASQTKPVAAPPRNFQPAPPTTIRRPVRRMPSVDELPVVAQNEIRAQSGQAPAVGLAAQKKRVGFLERLAGVGRAKKNPDAEMPAKLEPEFGQPRQFAAAEAPRLQPQPQPQAQMAASRGIRIERPRGEAAVASVPKRIEAQPRIQAAEVAAAPAESFAEDDLEIPAFLRRRAN